MDLFRSVVLAVLLLGMACKSGGAGHDLGGDGLPGRDAPTMPEGGADGDPGAADASPGDRPTVDAPADLAPGEGGNGDAWSGEALALDAPAADGTGQPCGAVSVVGCCAGEELRWCDPDTGTLVIEDCAAALHCGWDPIGEYYDCGTSGGSDPGGGYPRVCP